MSYKTTIKPAIAAAALCFFLSVAASRADCGKERWNVKTLQDVDAREVGMTPDTSKTIADLRKVSPPTDLKTIGDVRQPDEYVTYQVHALLIGFKKESDEDYHLVISYPESTEVTMIAEIPNPECANQNYSNEFNIARQFVEALHTVSSKLYRLPQPIPVTVTGVFFFDFLHGQTGVAENGAEIHPVLKITTE